ncbi:MAG: aspartyl protease family protein [Verrucomicrobia bacterium]|nr:aspartyl protease family protein [Verrucomicrobiota bacterium]
MKLSLWQVAVLLAAAWPSPVRAEEPRSAALRWESLRGDAPAAHDAAAAARLDATLRAAGGVEVPLKRWRGMYAVQVRLPRRAALAFLDTGAPRNALSGAAAREAGLGDGESAWLRTRVELGGVELGPFVLRVEDSPARLRRPGLLGLPTLQAFGAVLDPARGKLFVAPRQPRALSAALAADRTRRALPLLRSGERDRLYVSATINGVRGFLLLDTGVANTTLHQSAGARTGIVWQSRPDKVSIDYRGREHPVYQGRPASFTLGGVPVPPVTFVRRDQSLLEYVAYDAPAAWGEFFGLLGNDVLERLEAIVDLPGERLYLRKK